MPISYADAEDRDLLPPGVYQLKMEVTPGSCGEDGMLMLAKNGRTMHLALVYTVVSPADHSGRKIWDYVTVAIDESVQPPLEPAKLDKLRSSVRMGRSKIKALINSARGLDPDDKSQAAQAARAINSHEDLTGMTFWAEVGERAGRDGYGPSNCIEHVLQPGDTDYPIRTAANGGAPVRSSLPPSTAVTSLTDDLLDEIPF